MLFYDKSTGGEFWRIEYSFYISVKPENFKNNYLGIEMRTITKPRMKCLLNYISVKRKPRLKKIVLRNVVQHGNFFKNQFYFHSP